jgi:hypothetical protein
MHYVHQTAGRVWVNTFRGILTTSGCFRKLRFDTGRPHSGLMDCHRRQVHKAFITHIGFRLNLEVQAMYSYGERSQSKLFQVNTFFLL